MQKSFLLVGVFALTVFALGQSGVPAYHSAPPKRTEKLAPILPEEQLWGEHFQNEYQKVAYRLAKKIPNVIYQQPCYCYCDRMGHGSLHSCFESTHAANCAACMKELFYAYRQTQKGKTAKQIREGIIRGEWKSIDLNNVSEGL